MVVSSPSPPSSPAGFLVRPALSSHQPVSSTAFLKALFPLGIRRRRASPSRIVATSASYGYNSPPPSSNDAFHPRLPFQYQPRNPNSGGREDYEDEQSVVGDCLVFEEGAFEVGDPLGSLDSDGSGEENRGRPQRAKPIAEVKVESLVPEKWRETVEEINMTKKEKRKIAQELKFGSKLERRKKLPMPDLEEYRTYRELKLSQLKPVFLDTPRDFPPPSPKEVGPPTPSGGRVSPKNPRLAIKDESLDRISNFFNSRDYVPEENDDDKKPGKRKLFTQEEKILLNKRIPNLADATSSKWLPLHAFAASGEFYLLDALLKHNVDVNAPDKDGLCAIHRAILGNKVAVFNYLLRESANPFVRDQDGATLMHYAVLNASTQIIKILLLYDVDIDLPDEDGWTPLHLAVQTLRTDVVRLLLIKGADRASKTRDGWTPLDLCLHSGHHLRTFELIKLLKEPPRSKPTG
ncbi:unnamed protein product [Spirodela intermedia]|uniref:Uncharacterized protein n=1 Tax=Spirodela intermedia TaxID=51605 RepID=A0A7I8L2U6_SPIIN|nr:unnamed protein product [Spirodela intermedia]